MKKEYKEIRKIKRRFLQTLHFKTLVTRGDNAAYNHLLDGSGR